MGYSPRGHKESDATKQLNTTTFFLSLDLNPEGWGGGGADMLLSSYRQEKIQQEKSTQRGGPAWEREKD